MATDLPLSNLLLRLSPRHPLARLLTDPFFSRLARVEYAVLSTSLARYLGRVLSASLLVTLHALVLAAVLSRYRAQRNLFLSALALFEPISRTFDALHAPPSSQELKHLLSFSLLLSFFSLAESVTISPTTANKQPPPRVALFPSLLAKLRPTTPSPRTAFPQPRPLKLPPISPLSHSLTPLHPLSLPAYYFQSDLRYRLFKLLLLWIAARRDGTGASIIWDWFIEPFYILFAQRADRKYGKGRRRIVRIVVDEVDTNIDGTTEPTIRAGSTKERRKSLFGESPPLGFRKAFGETSTAISSEGGGADDRTTTIHSESPTIATTTQRRITRESEDEAARAYDTLDDSFDSSLSTSHREAETTDEEDNTASPISYRYSHRGGEGKFPTPNHVPYRLTSSSFPIQGRSSNPALAALAQQQNGFDSPTPMSSTLSIGGYEIEPIHLPSQPSSSSPLPSSHSHGNAIRPLQASPTKSTVSGSGRKSAGDIRKYLDSVQSEMGNALAAGEDVGADSWVRGGTNGGFGGAAW